MTIEDFLNRLGTISERLEIAGRQVPGMIRRMDMGNEEEKEFLECLKLFMIEATQGFSQIIEGYRKVTEAKLRLLQFHKEFPDIDEAAARDIIDGGAAGEESALQKMALRGLGRKSALERIHAVRTSWAGLLEERYSEAVSARPPEF